LACSRSHRVRSNFCSRRSCDLVYQHALSCGYDEEGIHLDFMVTAGAGYREVRGSSSLVGSIATITDFTTQPVVTSSPAPRATHTVGA